MPYKVCVYVPENYKEQVKTAMFAQGAGKMGGYDCCCFEYKGQGQFRPLEGSHPFLGKANEIEKVEEYKIELYVPTEVISQVIKAMKLAHPYEVVAYDVFKIEEV